MVLRWRANWDRRDDFSMGVWRDGRLLGGMGLHRVDWNARSMMLGYWLREGAWGQGYATEAARLALDLAFGPCGMRRVWLRCASGNERSIRLAKRLGMVEEERQPNAMRDTEGRPWDVLIFGLER
jgi:RimJ/RimL family protein N-acetyltransferase